MLIAHKEYIDKLAHLSLHEEVHHGVREGVCKGLDVRTAAHERVDECAVDHAKRLGARVVDVHDRQVAQEAHVEWDTAGVRGRVARAHKLDAFERDPLVVFRAPEPVL